MTEIDKRIIYYYRNGFRAKDIAQKIGIMEKSVRNRLQTLRRKGLLTRWWEEGDKC